MKKYIAKIIMVEHFGAGFSDNENARLIMTTGRYYIIALLK
jgi:hypothetical protein